ncbi:MAG: VOC family protein [Bacteroidota bacterium]
MKKYFFRTALVFVLLAVHALSYAQTPSAKDAKVKSSDDIVQPKDMPLVFRRTTLIVRDIEKSLLLYRDAIGMEVIYDNLIRRPHPEEDREQVLRLVFLKATSSFYGVLGLLEYDYENENKTDKPIRREGFTAQNVVLLFNSVNQEEQFKKIKEVPGVEIMGEPTLTKYPSYDGKSFTRVMVSKFYDPDGFIVEFNKLLDNL